MLLIKENKWYCTSRFFWISERRSYTVTRTWKSNLAEIPRVLPADTYGSKTARRVPVVVQFIVESGKVRANNARGIDQRLFDIVFYRIVLAGPKCCKMSSSCVTSVWRNADSNRAGTMERRRETGTSTGIKTASNSQKRPARFAGWKFNFPTSWSRRYVDTCFRTGPRTVRRLTALRSTHVEISWILCSALFFFIFFFLPFFFLLFPPVATSKELLQACRCATPDRVNWSETRLIFKVCCGDRPYFPFASRFQLTR